MGPAQPKVAFVAHEGPETHEIGQMASIAQANAADKLEEDDDAEEIKF